MFDATEERATLEDHLATALTQRYCPICYILSDKTYNLLCQLQYDAVHNAEVRAYVTAAGGYCNFHFWYLEKLTSPVTNAQFLESLLEKIKAEILDHQSTPQGVFTFLTIEARCPVCRTCRIWEEELLALFTAKIPEKGFWAAYQHCRGLCLPHLAQILDRLPDPEARVALVAAACHQLDVLIKELRLQVVKWQTKERILGEERDSTYRAIEKLVGGNRYRTH